MTPPDAKNPPSTDDPAYRARATRRSATWTVTSAATNAPVRMDADDVAARLLVMAELAEAGWCLLGRPLPEYDRATMPGLLIRPTKST